MPMMVVVPVVVPPVMPISISGFSYGMDHNDGSDDSTNHDGSDHQPIGAARRWSGNRTSHNHHRGDQRKERFSHCSLHDCCRFLSAPTGSATH
jgi:hypothetical protein